MPKAMTAPVIAIVVTSYLLLVAGTIGVHAQDTGPSVPTAVSVLELSGPTKSSELGGKIQYYLDDSHELSVEQMLGDYSSSFQPLQSVIADFGYVKSAIWLRLDLLNKTENEHQWRIHFRENFKQVFDVFVVDEDNNSKNVLSQSLEKSFHDRSISYPELVAPIDLDPGKQATVFIRYWSQGSSNLEFGFETVDSFASVAAGRTAKNFVYYGMMLLLIIASLVALIVFRHMVFAAYAANASSVLIYLMHADGVTFQYLWPTLPKFNSYASVLIGSSIIIFAANYARVFLNTAKRQPIFNKLFLGVIGLTVMMNVSAPFLDIQMLKKTLILMALMSLSLCVLSGIMAARVRFKQVRFYVFAWIGFLGASSLMTMRHWLGLEISQDLQHDIMRVVMVFDAGLMGLAIADRHLQLRQSRQDALEKSLGQANRNLKLNQRLVDLEKQYTLAANLAESKDRQFANTIHDLRQPLHALRLNVRNLAGSNSQQAGNPKDVEDTFTYLERLVADHLDASTSADILEIAPTISGHEDALGVQEILKSVHEMFSPDAAEKGLDFRFVAGRQDAEVDPLVLMRLVTNLVSNAIKYTQSGKVLIGSRRVGNILRIEVHDTGSGMDEAEFESAKQFANRLEKERDDPGGHGVGLQIVADLTKKYGFGLRLDPRRKNGSSIYIEIPVQSANAGSKVAAL